jgi:hypothetical protein
MRRLARAVRGVAAALAGVLGGVVAAAMVLVISAAGAAEADMGIGVWAAPPHDLNTVISNITKWLVGLLLSLATLFLTVGGVRLLLSGGDPGEVGKAKETLKNAAYGYGLAALAPVLAAILKGLVGG